MTTETKFKLSLADVNALFKIKYEKLSENVYNSANVLLGRVKKSYNFTGRKLQISIPQSFSGGVGSGSLPQANAAKYVAAEIEAKKVYAVVDVDRETIKASLSSEGAFVQATKEVVKKGVESFMRNMSRILFNDGTGRLGKVAAAGVEEILLSTGEATTDAQNNPNDATKLTIEDFKEANFEERDLIQVVAGSAASADLRADAKLEIDQVLVDEGAIIIRGVGLSVSAGDDLVMQGSLRNDPMGLKGAIKAATPGESLHAVPSSRRWSSEEIDMADRSSQDVSTDLLNEMMLKIKKKCGKTPNLIVTSYKQYELILNLMESKKQFNVNTRAGLKSKSGADISFSGVEFMSIDGAVGIFPERFVEDDRIYFLNDSHIHMYHRPDFGWFDDDGTVFLRKHDRDEYEARYGGYLETYINPCFHGVIKGLSLSLTV